MFKQYIGSAGKDQLCPLCRDDVALVFMKNTGKWRCPNCGESIDDMTRFARRKRRLVAPNSVENQSVHLSQVSAEEFISRTSLSNIQNDKYSSAKEAWEADV